MTLTQAVTDLGILGLFLVAGYAIRQIVPVFRKLYIPVPVLAGTLSLLLGPQVGGIIELPASFAEYSTALGGLVFTALVWGVTINLDRVKSYLDYTLIEFSVTWWQALLGSLVAYACISIWTDMPQGWGLMAPFSFLSGHPSAASMGAMFDSYGILGTTDIGMVLSTVGLLAAILLGTVFVNIGIRKNHAVFVKPGQKGEKLSPSLIPEDKQTPVGMTKIEPAALDNLLFQLAVILCVQWFGDQLLHYLGMVNSIIASLPTMIGGVIGSLILWPVARKTRLDRFVDIKSVKTIGNLSVDIMITGAIATLNLAFAAKYWIPMVIISVVCIGFTAAYVFFMCYKCTKEFWFEKACFIYGMATGVVATGFAVHRMLDPEGKSPVPEIQGVASGLQSPITFPLYTVFVLMAVNKPGMEAVVSGIMAVVLTAAIWIFFRKGVKVEAGR